MIAGASYMASWVAILREVHLDVLEGLTKGVICRKTLALHLHGVASGCTNWYKL